MIAEKFLNHFVLIYLLVVFSGQVMYSSWLRLKRKKLQRARYVQGLPDDIFLNHSEKLSKRKIEALVENVILLATIVITPFILYAFAGTPDKEGLAFTFIGLILWVVYSGSDVAKSFWGGLTFKALAAFTNPFQVGDRVNLKGVDGKVISFGTFFVKLQTPNDDAVSIPTRALWDETMISINGGARASLCVMNFYLAPFVDNKHRQEAEDAIWNAIQASTYFDPTKPMQIYLTQNEESIQLTAKAYVASTYDESLFCSDVTRAFLDFASERKLPIAAHRDS